MLFQLLPIVLPTLISLASVSTAQFTPPIAFSNILKSPIDPNITISYKSPDPGTCTTAFSSQKQYSGYVSLPPFTIQPYQQNYSINTFFWFIEARQNPNTAPLTIWLNGGPGSSSMIGLFHESGPCEVVQVEDGTYGTQDRMWGWDRSSNVLYIDQPAQVGFSYDKPVNKSHDLITDTYFGPSEAPSNIPAYLFLNGTFSSGNINNTANTTDIAASATWHFLQAFLSAFPQYNPGVQPNSSTTAATAVNLFAESYGGQYGPTFANYFETQNARRITGDLPRNSTLEIRLNSLGIINGMVDLLVQQPYYAKFAYNNTYDIQAFDQTTMLNALSDFTAPGGCKELIGSCRASIQTQDPKGEGDSDQTNTLCSQALMVCLDVQNQYIASGRDVYDIRVKMPSDFPSPAYLEYLNYDTVQQSIGAMVNYTESNTVVQDAFVSTGDELRGTQLNQLSSLLSLGVKVALIYGDADFICNWMGGEAVSTALAALQPTYATEFPEAGYADIIVNSSYIGGAVRQYGNLSFTRVYDSGHLVPAYQPETAFTVFTRIIEGTDISTGEPIDLDSYASKGSPSANHTNKTPSQEDSLCWIRDFNDTCTSDQIEQLLQAKGVVINGVWYEKESDYDPPSSSVIAGVPGSLPTNTPTPSSQKSASSTAQLTGVYIATATPTTTSGAPSIRLSGYDTRMFHVRDATNLDLPAWLHLPPINIKKFLFWPGSLLILTGVGFVM